MNAEDLAATLYTVGVPFLSRAAKAVTLPSPVGRYIPRVFACVEDLANAIANDDDLASGFRWLFRCHFARTCVLIHRSEY